MRSYDPQRARLRTFLRVCVDHLVANEDKAARRLKRGGDAQFLPLDFESAEGELQQVEIPSPDSMEDFFEREWVRSIFSLSLERLREECQQRGKVVHFRLLEFYDIDEAGKEFTYEEVARQFSLKTSDVTNYLAFARREFRRDCSGPAARDDRKRRRIPARGAYAAGNRRAVGRTAMKWLSDEALDRLRAAADAPDLSGTGYVLLDKLGSGGMGGVFRVRAHGPGPGGCAQGALGSRTPAASSAHDCCAKPKSSRNLSIPELSPYTTLAPCPMAACFTP